MNMSATSLNHVHSFFFQAPGPGTNQKTPAGSLVVGALLFSTAGAHLTGVNRNWNIKIQQKIIFK
jgi:hypothetical protein